MPSSIARCTSATAIISYLCRTIPKIGNGCFGRAERCIAFLHTFGTAVMRQTARWERSPVSRWRAGSQGLHDPPPVRTLSVQYAETTDGVLPVQVGLSVHSLSCGRLCLPQVRIIFSHFPYIRAGIPRISAHYAEAIMDAICSSQIFGHSYSLTLSDCTDICPYTTPKLTEYSPVRSDLRLRTPYFLYRPESVAKEICFRSW